MAVRSDPHWLLRVIASSFLQKDPPPGSIADKAECLLNGTDHGWAVDDYGHLNPRNQHIRELWHKTMAVGGLPEECVRLDESKKQS